MAETCARLRSLDVIVARRVSGLLLGGEEQEQLGFRALFTLAANCPLLEVSVEHFTHELVDLQRLPGP